MSLYASWVHGNSVLLEKVDAINVTNKAGVYKAFNGPDNIGGASGDIIRLGGHGSAACLRLGWAARFVIYDDGDKNLNKSGEFWCHYAIPTPVIEDNKRATAKAVLLNYESSDISAISIDRMGVWDGNRRLNEDASPSISSNNHNGGISGHVYDFKSHPLPDPSKLWRMSLPEIPIYFGVSVTLRIRAHEARDDFLEIRGVGIDFDVK